MEWSGQYILPYLVHEKIYKNYLNIFFKIHCKQRTELKFANDNFHYNLFITFSSIYEISSRQTTKGLDTNKIEDLVLQ